MGKKLPKSNKHKKLKFVDPYYKGPGPQKRGGKKLLPNEPPTTEQINNQEVCHQMKEFMEMKTNMEQNKPKRKKKKKVLKDDFIIVRNDIVDMEPGSTRIPSVVKQKKYESEARFMSRLQTMTDQAIAEAKVEEKYDIKLVNVDKKGNAEYVTAPKEVSEAKKEKRKKYKEKQEEKKRMKLDDHQYDLKKEKIKFGEVVSAPPVLTHKPRKAPELTKPGKRELALKQLFLPSSSLESNPPTTKKKYMKKMAPAKRKLIEDERIRAIQMYRMLKNKKA